MSIKPVLVPDHTANDLRRLMDHFAEASTGPTRQQLAESRAAVAAAQGVSEGAEKEYHVINHKGTPTVVSPNGKMNKNFSSTYDAQQFAKKKNAEIDKKKRVSESDSGTVDMKGKKCTTCKKGTYQETDIQDDMHGELHCTKCNTVIKSRQPADSKKKRVAEGSAGAELKAIDGDYYEDSTDFFSMFDQDHFDREEESEDGMEIRGYIDGKCVMVFKYSTPDMMGGWGNYDDSALMAEQDTGLPSAVQESLIDDDSTDIRELLNFNLFRDYESFKDGDIDPGSYSPEEIQEWEQLFAAWGPVADQLERQINKAAAKGAVLTPEQNQEINDNWYDGSDAYDDPLRELPGIYAREIPIIRKILRQSIKDLTGLADDGRKQQFRGTGNAGMPRTDDDGNILEQGMAETADGVKYGVFAKGGSVGSQRFRDDPLKTFDSKEEAVADARRRRSGLSKGERGYYRMGYVVKPIKGSAEQVDEIDMGLVGDAMAGAAAGLGSVGLGSYIGHKIGNKIGQKFIDRSNRKKAEAGRKEAEAGSEKMKAIEKARADRIAANKAYRDHENLHGYELAQDHPEYQNRVNLGNKKFRNMDVPSAFDEEQQVYEKSESVRHGNNDHNVYHHVDESVDPIEQLRADIKRFAQ